MRWPLFMCGVFFLLISAYMDNVRGTLIPALSHLYNFDYSTSGLILVAGQLGALLCTALLLPATNRWSLKQVGVFACLLGTLVSVGCLFVRSRFSILVWGASIGGGIAVLGSLSSLFTEKSADHKNKTKAMAACHATYGFASFLAPVIAGFVLQDVQRWHYLYLGVVPAIGLLSIYCWRFAPSHNSANLADQKQPLHLTGEQWLSVAVIVFYVGGEVLAAMWMTTWFMSEGKSLQEGAWATSVFFLLMMLTRILCSIFATPYRVLPIIWASIIVPSMCFVIGRVFDIFWLIPFMGLLGPFFPLFITYTSMRFPERGRTIILWMLTAMQGLLSIMNFVTGHVADKFGMGVAYWLPPVLIFICGVLLAISQSKRTDVHKA